jgi:hypothetical protein
MRSVPPASPPTKIQRLIFGEFLDLYQVMAVSSGGASRARCQYLGVTRPVPIPRVTQSFLKVYMWLITQDLAGKIDVGL